MRRRLLLTLILAFALPVMAQTAVYRWVDKDGVVHYSDQPHPGAVKVNLGAPQVTHFKVPSGNAVAQPRARNGAEKPRAYKVAILAPADGTTLRPANHEVHARVRVTPALGPHALLQYRLDGKALGQPTAATRALIRQVYRGTHTLVATVLVPGGASAGSASSTFYVHQHSILLNRHNKPGPGGG